MISQGQNYIISEHSLERLKLGYTCHGLIKKSLGYFNFEIGHETADREVKIEYVIMEFKRQIRVGDRNLRYNSIP